MTFISIDYMFSDLLKLSSAFGHFLHKTFFFCFKYLGLRDSKRKQKVK